MSVTARVYRRRPRETSAKDIGEKELAWRPVRHNYTRFMPDGEQVIGRIDYIDPPEWEKRGVTPTVYVVQSEGESLP